MTGCPSPGAGLRDGWLLVVVELQRCKDKAFVHGLTVVSGDESRIIDAEQLRESVIPHRRIRRLGRYVTQAIIWLRRTYHLEFRDEEEPARMPPRRTGPIYG